MLLFPVIVKTNLSGIIAIDSTSCIDTLSLDIMIHQTVSNILSSLLKRISNENELLEMKQRLDLAFLAANDAYWDAQLVSEEFFFHRIFKGCWIMIYPI